MSRKYTGSLGIVVESDPQRLEFEAAVKAWGNGECTYEEVWAKNPRNRRRSFKGFLWYLLTGVIR